MTKASAGLRAVATLPPPREPVGWPAWRLREEVASGRLGVVDVVQAHLDRLDEVQPWLNAVVAVRRGAALADAEAIQSRLDAGQAAGPLCGVPFTAKDVVATAGVPTCCGSAAFGGNVPEVDAVAVGRLRAAGAVLIAKTNCPELAFGVTTDNETYGATRSPWGFHSPGGSSGGEAALLAAGASALGVGTDYGGSLRWPAQCCGVLALRPGVGAVDGTGQLPERGGRMDGRPGPAYGSDSVQRHFQVIGPLARSVADLATALAVMQGADPAAVSSAFTGSNPIRPELLEGVRIGWVSREDTQAVGAGVSSVLRAVVSGMSVAGVATEPVEGLLDGLHGIFNALRATDPMNDLRAAIGLRSGCLGAAARAVLDTAPQSSADPAPLWASLRRRRDEVMAQLAVTPVVLFPVSPAPACDLEGSGDVDGQHVEGFALMAQCRAVSALGVPALSIPVGSDRHGLPVAIQVLASPGGEQLLLLVGRMLERLYGGRQEPPWLDR